MSGLTARLRLRHIRPRRGNTSPPPTPTGTPSRRPCSRCRSASTSCASTPTMSASPQYQPARATPLSRTWRLDATGTEIASTSTNQQARGRSCSAPNCSRSAEEPSRSHSLLAGSATNRMRAGAFSDCSRVGPERQRCRTAMTSATGRSTAWRRRTRGRSALSRGRGRARAGPATARPPRGRAERAAQPRRHRWPRLPDGECPGRLASARPRCDGDLARRGGGR